MFLLSAEETAERGGVEAAWTSTWTETGVMTHVGRTSWQMEHPAQREGACRAGSRGRGGTWAFTPKDMVATEDGGQSSMCRLGAHWRPLVASRGRAVGYEGQTWLRCSQAPSGGCLEERTVGGAGKSGRRALLWPGRDGGGREEELL